MQELKFETITLDGLPELTKMFVETFNAPPWNDQWNMQTAGTRLERMVKSEGFIGVAARQDGQLCGLILGFREQYFDGMVIEIKEFCVKNSIRGQGLGSKILGYFEEQLKSEGIKRIHLLTARGELTERFYSRQGFGALDEMVYMGKTL